MVCGVQAIYFIKPDIIILLSGGRVKRILITYSNVKKLGQFQPSAQIIMGEQVANNKEIQQLMYLKLDKGKWYILSEPKSPGLVKKEYLPIGNRLVYPKKWGRKKAANVLLNFLTKDNELMKEQAEERLEYLYNLTNEVNDWK